jgi:hypothetical protein
MAYVHLPSRREPLGLPEFYDASLPACHGLRTPADLHTLANAGVSVLPSAYVKTLGVRNKLTSKLYQHFRVRVTPTAYRILCLRFARFVRRSFNSATDARLDTGGWLAVARRGLSPRKIRRALLGRDNVRAEPPAEAGADWRGRTLTTMAWSGARRRLPLRVGSSQGLGVFAVRWSRRWITR